MKFIVVINPQANQVRRNPELIKTIVDQFARYAQIIHPQTIPALHDALLTIRRHTNFSQVVLCIVGGDGTCKQMIDWIIKLPEAERPILLLVGGGQFNFMTKHVGFTSGNPVRNLSRLFSRSDAFVVRRWRPIAVHDSLTNSTHHGAVMANGVVSDTIELYEKNGKGGMIDVMKLVAIVCSSHVQSMLGTAKSRVNHTKGLVLIDDLPITFRNQSTLFVGAVNHFLPLCHPFREPIEPNRCGTFAYWGELSPIAMSIPSLWTGTISPLTDRWTHNANADRITLITRDARMIIDGDFFSWPTPEGSKQDRTFTISRGPEISLLYAM